jgi:hypothetical protein
MLDSARFSDHETAELAAALGTREMESSRRRAKRLFLQSLKEPTENAIAQAVWAAEEMNWTLFDPDLMDLSESFEADARTLARSGDRPAALDASWRWHGDEPFASEPPIFGSYYASVDEDYESGLAFAKEGLKANPDDTTLLNNAAFCLACSGEVDEARRVFGRIRFRSEDTEEERTALLATRGLIAYRSGRVEEGREGYAAAMASTKDASIRAVAAIMFAREEIRANTPLGKDAARQAFELEKRAESEGGAVAPELRAWLRQLQSALADHAVR